MRVRTSINAATTFNDPITLTTYTPGYQTGAAAGQQTIVRHGSSIYIASINFRGTSFWRSTDNGATFSNELKISGGGFAPQIAVDPLIPSRVHVVNGWYYLSTDGGVTFNGGINPHLNFNDWVWPSMKIGPDGAVHYAASVTRGFSPMDHRDIHYRRIAPATAASPSAGDSCLSLTTVRAVPQRRIDNVQIPSSPVINFSTAMTAEMWVKRNSYNNYRDSYYQELFRKKRNLAEGSYVLGAWWDNYQIYSRLVTTNSADKFNGEWIGSATTLPLGVWTHIAMTYDTAGTNNWRLYVNGLLTASATVKGTIVTELADAPLVIGESMSDDGACFIDEVRLWNRARSQAEIVADMHRQLSGSEPGLAAYYPFNGSYKNVCGHELDAVPMFRETFAATGVKPPCVVRQLPANGDSGVSVNEKLVLVFNEPVSKGSGLITITAMVDGSPGPIFDTIKADGNGVSIRGDTVTITLSKAFDVDKTYFVTMPAGCFTNASKVAFQGISSPAAWRFKTGKQVKAVAEASLKPTDRLVVKALRDAIVVKYSGSAPSSVRVMVSNLKGRVVWNSQAIMLAQKSGTITLPLKLAPGVYQCEIEHADAVRQWRTVQKLYLAR